MPVIGYGTFRTDPGESGPAVMEALKVGYRHLDFAHVYGNEEEIGKTLTEAFSAGLVKREELFLVGKLWNSDHEAHIVPLAYEKSCKNLGVEYLDLYLIHFPVAQNHTGLDKPDCGPASEFGKTPLIDTWRAMEKLVDAGKCKSIGVSNFPLCLMHDLYNQCRIKPAMNQIEVHPFYVRDSLVNYCISRGIRVTAHTPLGGGALNQTMWKTPNPLQHDVINSLAQAKNKEPAQIILRWHIQRGIIVIPKSKNPARMKTNIDIFDFELSPEEMAKISALDRYATAKTNPNPISFFLEGPDAFCKDGTDIFD